ncbi:hypothetical protein Q8W71_13815 [Methylobacterium sp. NEAU 140]|uniref:hypothetical protein n=1 Tax=Methylobacterium sp. NEAU 140 TaxID=3064945 RepID=UPI002736069D|nr:hypothetical protein [Methylobacterium sp. NEAU 140]MDP4023708.1 hypothetical protein [Methylobacterium sp. NEAU 140]
MEFLQWLNGWVSTLGDWLSVLTFFVSGYTYITLRNVRAELISKAMLPRYIDLLTQEASNLSDLLADFQKNKNDIELIISRSLVNVRTIENKTAGPTKAKAKSVAKQIQSFEAVPWFGSRKELDASAARTIYISITVLIEQMNRLAEDQRFGA